MIMTSEEAARERDRVRQEANERTEKERAQSSKDRAQEVGRRNSERGQQRESAANALTSGNADIKLAEIAKLGGPVGRKLEREMRQFQQTGRVSSWLAGETLKAEAAQNAAQQSAFRQQLVDVISSPSSSILLGPIAPPDKPLYRKPEIRAEGGGGEAPCIGLNLYVRIVQEDQEVWVGAGTIAGQLPSNFDETSGKSIASGGSGNVWAEVNINDDTGEIVSVAVSGGGATPENTYTSFYYALGYYEYNDGIPAVINYACGSIDVTVCRNWFAVEAPFYGVNMNRCGCNY